MISEFDKLNPQEKELLIKAPVLLSVLAACSGHTINKAQKSDAVKLAHIKTFSAVPELQPYYKEVEKNFKHYFEQIAEQYSPFDEVQRHLLKQEINSVHKIIGKLAPTYGSLLSKSLERYVSHVKRATYSIFQDFIFPLVMLDLKDGNFKSF
jgi:hypothetical protein